ncbi:uncharacterized mitochondrial protein AtMg00810-like [Lycium ferocissimum]|uniref:uncharacterized mitochondrial protein AtMg00810-like n=1 Tax=Lycium ferocissimum TaxID=112874 RepID=UPI0028150BB8|nr:uncharacterized mitochondrial protein AtMg00810-like [Lycium ferocissimum]
MCDPVVARAAYYNPSLQEPITLIYQQLVGRLLYLTIARPDIAFAVQTLSQFMHAPKRSHMEAAIRVVKYIKHSPGYCDADLGTCANTRKSITGYLVTYGNSLISWKSKKQNQYLVAIKLSRRSDIVSSASLLIGPVEMVWLVGLFKELEVSLQLPILIFL